MRQGEKLGKKLVRAVGFDEIIDERDALEMRGTNELMLREVKRFLYYSSGEIKLSLCEYILTISGEDLYCSSYLGGLVRVNGNIKSLNIEKRDESGKNE